MAIVARGRDIIYFLGFLCIFMYNKGGEILVGVI